MMAPYDDSWPMARSISPRLRARLNAIGSRTRPVTNDIVGMIGLAIILALVVVAALAPVLPIADPNLQYLAGRLHPPSLQNWLGTDALGRDILARIIYGARPTLTIVACVLVLSVPLGVLLGAAAGLFRLLDPPIMRVCDMFMAFPRLILAIALAATLGASTTTVIIAVATTGWPRYARLARSEAAGYRHAEFIEAARVLGASPIRLLFCHVLPLCTPSAIVRAMLDASSIVLITSGLGFLGLSVPAPQAEWGAMVADGRNVMLEAWWVSTIPGLAILVLSVGFSLLGDALRDTLDPRAR